MKGILFAFALLIISKGAFAQIEHPVKWSYAAKRVSNTEAVVFLKATIQDKWHIYSLTGKDGSPIKTSFKFSASKDISPMGKPAEPKPLIRYEDAIKMNVSYFEKEVVFQQKIKLNTPNAATVTGILQYMACNNIHCNPPEDINFTIPLGK